MTMGHCILLDKDDANLYKSAQVLVTCYPFCSCIILIKHDIMSILNLDCVQEVGKKLSEVVMHQGGEIWQS